MEQEGTVRKFLERWSFSKSCSSRAFVYMYRFWSVFPGRCILMPLKCRKHDITEHLECMYSFLCKNSQVIAVCFGNACLGNSVIVNLCQLLWIMQCFCSPNKDMFMLLYFKADLKERFLICCKGKLCLNFYQAHFMLSELFFWVFSFSWAVML